HKARRCRHSPVLGRGARHAPLRNEQPDSRPDAMTIDNEPSWNQTWLAVCCRGVHCRPIEGAMRVKTVVCFGDSNTWGYDPASKERLGPDARWAGVLAKTLGDGYRVIEEGLKGRTTVVDDP